MIWSSSSMSLPPKLMKHGIQRPMGQIKGGIGYCFSLKGRVKTSCWTCWKTGFYNITCSWHMCNSIFLLQHITTSLSFCCNNIIFRRYNLGGVALSCHKRYICRGRSIECLVLFLFYGNIPSCFASCYSSFILGWFNFCVFVVIEPFFMFVLCRLVKIWTI